MRQASDDRQWQVIAGLTSRVDESRAAEQGALVGRYGTRRWRVLGRLLLGARS